MEAVKTMIYDQDLPMHLWVEAARTTVYVHNRISHSALVPQKSLKRFAKILESRGN